MSNFETAQSRGPERVTKDAKLGGLQNLSPQQVFEQYQAKDFRIKEHNFLDLYPEAKIAQDYREIEAFKKSPNYEKPTTWGIALENLIVEQGRKNNWFSAEGIETSVQQLSEYDDMLGARADVLLEMRNQQGETVQIAMDLTTAINEETLEKKKQKCVAWNKRGFLPKVKYFQSELTGKRGVLSDVPVVVAGLDRENLLQLCDAIGKQENLQAHVAQLLILEQIRYELSFQQALALRDKGPQDKITQKIERCLQMIDEVLDKKESLRPEDFEEKAFADQVCGFILDNYS